jgi:hypothetical protein
LQAARAEAGCWVPAAKAGTAGGGVGVLSCVVKAKVLSMAGGVRQA